MNVNTFNLRLALDWLRLIVQDRLKTHLGSDSDVTMTRLELEPDDGVLARFVRQYNPVYEELVVLLLSIVPHVNPKFFDGIVTELLPDGGDLTVLGGVRGTYHRGVLPTAETALFILGGTALDDRLSAQRMFSAEHWFSKQQILWLDHVPEGEPLLSGRIILNAELIEELTTGFVSRPAFSAEFPAEHIETSMEWSDLVLHPNTLRQIREIENWITHNHTLMQEWGMNRRVKPGYRALFYGPPGTGKTLTTSLLGKHTGRDVFRIDLSRVVSKYIGETEKNLSRLFDKAEHKDWILFFDEADALFGKRTDIRDAHDKYANQEVAYLLQRIEGYNGLVILATNQRANIDDAFVRRFQSIIHFPVPRPEERYTIWTNTMPPQIEVAHDIDWHHVARQYELTGAGILNVAHYCALEVLADSSLLLDMARLELAIKREYVKEGRVV